MQEFLGEIAGQFLPMVIRGSEELFYCFFVLHGILKYKKSEFNIQYCFNQCVQF